jgi:galactokinase
MNELVKAFYNVYNKADNISIVKSPLRICPLGAHIDHQDGMVTGMALDSSVNMVYAPGDDGYIQVKSLDFPDEEYFHTDHVPQMVPGFWGNYIRGSVLSLKRDYVIKRGFKAIISGKLPIGGLSSSAAVTTAYLMALCDVNGIKVSKMDLIRYSHWVETNYIGLKNGILDQASNILSKDGHLMFMDCKTGEHRLIKKPDTMPGFEVVVVYSGLSTALIGTDYNNRVDECRVAAWILQDFLNGSRKTLNEMRLRDIPAEIYNNYKDRLPERFRKRADHFFGEIQRVIDGVKAWESGDINTFGKLMFESGESSINKYECGCPELISIFRILKECKGVYGARFSGAGYRGCCIGLIDPDYKESIKETVAREYPLLHPEYRNMYRVNFCKTSDGAAFINNF